MRHGIARKYEGLMYAEQVIGIIGFLTPEHCMLYLLSPIKSIGALVFLYLKC